MKNIKNRLQFLKESTILFIRYNSKINVNENDENENDESYYKETSWTHTIDGEKITITIQDVEDYLDLNRVHIIEIPVDEIFHLCAHRNKTDSDTLNRWMRADLSFPIIVSKNENGKYNMILDGQHRILKAKNNNLKTIKARVLDLRNAPHIYKKMFS